MTISPEVQIALLVAVPSTLGSIAALVTSFHVGRKVRDVHVAINSRFDQLLALAKSSSFAEGEKSQADILGRIQADLKGHQDADDKVQAAILAGIEALKTPRWPRV